MGESSAIEMVVEREQPIATFESVSAD